MTSKSWPVANLSRGIRANDPREIAIVAAPSCRVRLPMGSCVRRHGVVSERIQIWPWLRPLSVLPTVLCIQ
jgi:hypothetical protein